MKRAYNYHQLEIIRVRAVGLGLHAEWIQDGPEPSAWLRVGQGVNEFTLCFFPGSKPIFTAQSQGHDPGELVALAKELVAIHATLTARHEFAPPRCERGGSEDCGGCRFDSDGVCEAQF